MANIIPYIIFGLLPSIIWLAYYLKKDVHPEPKRKIVKVFFYGVLAAAIIIFPELQLVRMVQASSLPLILVSLLSVFAVIAFMEEFSKYLVVKLTILKSSEFDEPTDAMIYMITAALGFAALENTLFLFSLGPFALGQTIWITAFRFLGATFLHALCSAVVGFFLALSILKKNQATLFGLKGAVLLHGLYNLSLMNPELVYQPLTGIMEVTGSIKLLVPIIILISLAFFVLWAFHKLKKMKSI